MFGGRGITKSGMGRFIEEVSSNESLRDKTSGRARSSPPLSPHLPSNSVPPYLQVRRCSWRIWGSISWSRSQTGIEVSIFSNRARPLTLESFWPGSSPSFDSISLGPCLLAKGFKEWTDLQLSISQERLCLPAPPQISQSLPSISRRLFVFEMTPSSLLLLPPFCYFLSLVLITFVISLFVE